MVRRTWKKVQEIIEKEIPDKPYLALLVENSEIRPFVRKLVETDFPNLFVLSQRELILEFKARVIKKIELKDNINMPGEKLYFDLKKGNADV